MPERCRQQKGTVMVSQSSGIDAVLSAIFRRIGQTVVSRPKLIILLFILASLGLATFIPTLTVNNDGRIYFVKDDPALTAQEKFETVFGSEQFITFFFESDTLFSPNAYHIVDGLVKKLERAKFNNQPLFEGVVSVFHAPALKPGAASLELVPFVQTENPTDEDMLKAKQRVMSHPIYGRSVVSKDGRNGAVMAYMRSVPSSEGEYSTAVSNAVEKIFASHEGLKSLNARMVGGPVFGAQMNRTTVREAVIFGSASVLVCMFALFVMFRRFSHVMAAISVVLISTLWTMALMAISGTEMSMIHALLPPSIIVTGLGSGVHIINEFRLLSGANSKSMALVKALESMGGPCLLTAITTAIGFCSMIAAPVQPMQTLGLFIGVGVMISFLSAVFFVPSLILIVGMSGDKNENYVPDASNQFFESLADKVVKTAKITAISFALAAAIMAAGISRLEVDTNFLHALRKDHPFRQTVEYVDDRMGASNGIELTVDSGAPGGIYDPEILRGIEKLQASLEESETDVVWVSLSVVDLLKELNLAVKGTRTLPETKAQAAELMFLYDVSGGSTSNILDSTARKARVTTRTRALSSERCQALEQTILERANTFLGSSLKRVAAASPPPEENTTGVDTPGSNTNPGSKDEDSNDIIIIEDEDDTIVIEDEDDDDTLVIIDDDDAQENSNSAGAPPGSGDSQTQRASNKNPAQLASTIDLSKRVPLELAGVTPLFARLNSYVITSQLKSFRLAAIIIGIIMIIMLRSFSLGAAVMLPNLLPIVSTYGIMGWLGIPMDFMSSVIAVAAIGVAVDGTIHIGTRFRRSRMGGANAETAARDVMTSVGRALVVTTLVLAAGFCVLAPSELASMANFGMLMAVCLVLALLFDLIMTPAVLSWLNPGSKTSMRDK
jgi:uncharacterized protein